MNNYLMLLEASTSASGKGSFQMIILMVLLFVGMYLRFFNRLKQQIRKLSHYKQIVIIPYKNMLVKRV